MPYFVYFESDIEFRAVLKAQWARNDAPRLISGLFSSFDRIKLRATPLNREAFSKFLNAKSASDRKLATTMARILSH